MFPNNPYFAPNNFNIPKYEIIKVNGKSSAQTFQMAPNSSTLLLDENNPIIYLATTDGAGYKTIKTYRIEPCEEPKPIDINNLEARIMKLEEIMNESNIRKFEPKQKQQPFNAQGDFEERPERIRQEHNEQY